MSRKANQPSANHLPISEMARGRESFKPLRHAKTHEKFSDVEYCIALGKAISIEADEWKERHPNIEYHHEGIDADVQRFCLNIYDAYKNGVSKDELSTYIKQSIDLNK